MYVASNDVVSVHRPNQGDIQGRFESPAQIRFVIEALPGESRNIQSGAFFTLFNSNLKTGYFPVKAPQKRIESFSCPRSRRLAVRSGFHYSEKRTRLGYSALRDRRDFASDGRTRLVRCLRRPQ